MSARWALIVIAAALGAGLAVAAASDPQVGVDVDRNGNGLIEIRFLEQLDAVRWDLDGDGMADDSATAARHAAAFGGGVADCSGGDCVGYELARSLDFRDPDSYASGEVNAAWLEGEGWMPIGGHREPFTGTFAGKGETIANLFIDRPSESYVGLFGEIAGAVRGLGVVNASVSAADTSGALAGANSGMVADSYVTGAVSCFRDSGGLVGANYGDIVRASSAASVTVVSVVGGLVGLNYGAISDSSATGRVTGSARVAGGLAGINFGEIGDSYASGETSAADIVGGLAAINQGPISASYTVGTVSGEGDDVGGIAGVNYAAIRGSFSAARVSGNHRVGGLVGINRVTGAIRASYATGAVSGGVGVGGLAGWSLGALDLSYATGDVSGTENDVGGLVGRNSGAVRASYATGDVSASHRVGGLAGYSNRDGSIHAAYATGAVAGQFESGGLVGWNSGAVRHSYATGAVSGVRDQGGLIGENEASGSIVASYWDTEASGLEEGVAYGDGEGARGGTTADLQTPTDATGLYADWDDAVWDFGDASQYPALRADLDGDGTATADEFGEQPRTVAQRVPSALAEIARLVSDIGRTLNIEDPAERALWVRVACRSVMDTLPQLSLTSDLARRAAIATLRHCRAVEQASRSASR